MQVLNSDANQGQLTILTEEEEDQLAHYLLRMSEMGFGLSHDTVMCLAYKIVEKVPRNHPFKKVGHGSMDSGGVIQGSRSAHLNHYRMLEHCVPTRILSMIFLESLGQYLAD